MPDPLLIIIILLVLLILYSILNASEVALVSFTRSKFEIPDGMDKRTQYLLTKLHNKGELFVPGTQNCINFISFLTASISIFFFAPDLADLLSATGISRATLIILSTIIIAIVISYVFLIFGELLPKKLAMRNPINFVNKHASALNRIYVILKPTAVLTTSITNALLKLFGVKKTSLKVSAAEDEILMMLESGNKKGTISEDTRKMVQGIFEFDDTAISDIMTHRTGMSALEDIASLSDTIDMAISTGYSRLPVYHDDLDNIVGIVYVKDLLRYISLIEPEKFKITDIMRVPLFVPRTKLCSELFAEMRDAKTQIAIVIDEYGGTEGLVTIEDLVEEIFGNIQDEYDNEEEEIQKLNETTFTVDGSTSIDELSDLMDTNVPDGDYDTISGLIIENLGYIPRSGEHPSIKIADLKLTVSEVDSRRIAKVLVVKDKII